MLSTALLAAALSLAAAVTAWGQYTEGYTEILYDEFRDEVLLGRSRITTMTLTGVANGN